MNGVGGLRHRPTLALHSLQRQVLCNIKLDSCSLSAGRIFQREVAARTAGRSRRPLTTLPPCFNVMRRVRSRIFCPNLPAAPSRRHRRRALQDVFDLALRRARRVAHVKARRRLREPAAAVSSGLSGNRSNRPRPMACGKVELLDRSRALVVASALNRGESASGTRSIGPLVEYEPIVLFSDHPGHSEPRKVRNHTHLCAASPSLCEVVLIFGICSHRCGPWPGALQRKCDPDHVREPAFARPLPSSAIETFALGE
jgi:hypothetical protein